LGALSCTGRVLDQATTHIQSKQLGVPLQRENSAILLDFTVTHYHLLCFFL